MKSLERAAETALEALKRAKLVRGSLVATRGAARALGLEREREPRTRQRLRVWAEAALSR
jgi:hypothetical protein